MNIELSPQQASRNLPPKQKRAAGIRNFVIGGIVLIALLGGFYWYTHQTAGGARVRNTAAPVTVAVAHQRDMQVIERTIGTVVANSSVSVTARVQGQLIKADFKEGQMVKAGDLLFEIDPAPYKAAYDSAAATLAGAKSTADRDASLLKQNAIAPVTNDAAQSAYLQARANLETAQLNLDFTRIRSPVNGKTGPILLQPGNLVSVNGTNAPLVTITQIQPIKVSFALPQADLPRIQARVAGKGLTAQVKLHDAGGAEDITAPVDFISNQVNATSGTIELRATFPNLDSALVPGQLVDVVVELSDIPNAIVVPREALNNGQDGQYVYVVNADSAAEVQTVKLLFDDGANDAIQGDVHDGDQVIVDGQLRVIPGAKVSITKAGAASGAPAAGRRGGRRGARGGRGGRRGGASDAG